MGISYLIPGGSDVTESGALPDPPPTSGACPTLAEIVAGVMAEMPTVADITAGIMAETPTVDEVVSTFIAALHARTAP